MALPGPSNQTRKDLGDNFAWKCLAEMLIWSSCGPHLLQGEEGPSHAATINLSPQQNVAVTNKIHTLCSLHA